MKIIVFLISVTTLSLFACKNPSKALSTQKEELINLPLETLIEIENADKTYDLVISFISKSSGIDTVLKEKIDAMITAFNNKNKTNLNPEIVAWGREGEKDYLFITKNLSTSQKTSFSSQIEEIVGSSDMVYINSNTKSVHKR